ncbi:MAG: hypothetical protein WA060_00490 [Minisyncoccia bacterium]
MPKIKNIIIFTAIAATFVLGYVFFLRPSPDEENLVSLPATTLPDINNSTDTVSGSVGAPLVAKDFLSLLLNVKNIKLNDQILSDPAFLSLRDSSITLEPDGNEGRPNPFAKFGNDSVPVQENINIPAPSSVDPVSGNSGASATPPSAPIIETPPAKP